LNNTVFIKETVKNLLALLWGRKAYKFFIRDWISLGDLAGCQEVLATLRFSKTLDPLVLERPAERKLLILAPHPDDETLGAGGTIVKAIRGGATVRTVYVTSGRPSLAEQMVQEALQVSEAVGYTTEFMGYSLHDIPLERKAQEQLAECIDRFEPEGVFLPFLLDDHDDHRRVSHLLHLAHRAGLLRRPFMVWAYQVYSMVFPNVLVDITGVAEEKAKAVNLWASQKASRDWAHYILGMNAFNSRFLKKTGQNYVESFFVLPSEEYFSLCQVYFEKGGTTAYYHPNYVRGPKAQ
jgi:LmbE family N-acetylglucosaminyl deacetylase